MNNELGPKPQIIAFCCMHCAYAAADLAGSSRFSYPTALKIVALPCTGRTDMGHILKTFEDGADGVLVAGCLPGRCHYLAGNLYAKQRVDYVGDLLEQIGLQSERLRMINISAGMGAKFAELANEFAHTITALGPTGLTKKPSSKEFPLPAGKTT
ncbi:MAG: hydrogenase iron-sulfur subunit [Gammaproteobacteria bacterium]|nr:hydrogenase iron-sulfur subunit [Gammaproteobacteria bacterium]